MHIRCITMDFVTTSVTRIVCEEIDNKGVSIIYHRERYLATSYVSSICFFIPFQVSNSIPRKITASRTCSETTKLSLRSPKNLTHRTYHRRVELPFLDPLNKIPYGIPVYVNGDQSF
ncbi:uncharacterized protein LOC143150876 [Ptiloglossa arizonensis]|uniref:uncharacterized protein LOC143150876 n=1 Tax=Ptiloglossa arizonensis TaxID=3350558 RepID=UPI003FA19137